MGIFIDCIEPHGRPRVRTVEVVPGTDVGIYILPLARDPSASLRRTVLRARSLHAPPGAMRIGWLRADDTGISLNEIERGVNLELIRDEVRSQAIPGMRLVQDARFELVMPDRSRVQFTLAPNLQVGAGAAATVGGSGTKSSRVKYAADNVFWLITDTRGLVVTFGTKIWDGLRDRLMKMGIDSRVLTFGTGFLVSGLTAGYVAWQQYSRAEAAEEAAQEAATQAEIATAARDASLATELHCIEQRKELAGALGEVVAQRRLQADQALQLSLSVGIAGERGVDAMRLAELPALDTKYRESTVGAVVGQMKPVAGDLSDCLSQEAALSTDLPGYLLAWHPDASLSCPSDYNAVVDGVNWQGPWGLSSRFVAEFGSGGDGGTGTTAEQIAELIGDARREPRWAAFTLAQGYREVLWTLVRVDLDGRPPVLPSQAQLWTLAFIDAYNRMPSLAGGVADSPVVDCVQAAVQDHAALSPPAVTAQPVLPDIVGVAFGEEAVVLTPTPGCPWPKDALKSGAMAALRSVGRLAVVQSDAEPVE